MTQLKLHPFWHEYYCEQCGRFVYTRNKVAIHDGEIITYCPHCDFVPND